jgi:small GTP-binding protein
MNKYSLDNIRKVLNNAATDAQLILGAELVEQINERLGKVLGYTPKVGFMGKTGVGKSSLCNALFGQDTCAVSHVEACTRDPKELIVSLGEQNEIVLMDLPGVGESNHRDEEYAELYEKILPELDLLVWVIKADDRAFSIDFEFYNNFVKPHMVEGLPLIIALNQCDKINPIRNWNVQNGTPGDLQIDAIQEKLASVANHFNIERHYVVPISATESYNLPLLVEEMVFALPVEKQLRTVGMIAKEFVRPEMRDSLFQKLVNYVAQGLNLGGRIGELFPVIGKLVGAAVGAILGGFFAVFE